jgi:membrane associated rhomboid family serine protease
MISDRDYMRERSSAFPWSATTWLILSLVVVFGFQQVDAVYFHTGLFSYLELSGTGLRHGFLWQLLTFQFLHAGVWHLFVNGLVLWWTGRFAESVMGGTRMVLAWLSAGTVGGLLQGLLMIPFPQFFGDSVVGASAGVAGLTSIFCLMERDAQIHIFWGLIPVRALYFLYGSIALSLFCTVVPFLPGMAHAAHLGGFLIGIAWFRQGWIDTYRPLPGQDAWEGLKRMATSRSRASKFRPTVLAGTRAATRAETSRPPVAPRDQYITTQVDPILEKIAAHGIQSLTAEERAILQNARNKMSGR